MGCNTSADAKAAKEDAQENKADTSAANANAANTANAAKACQLPLPRRRATVASAADTSARRFAFQNFDSTAFLNQSAPCLNAAANRIQLVFKFGTNQDRSDNRWGVSMLTVTAVVNAILNQVFAEGTSEEQAATKIQAAFRGHQTRKSISMKTSKPQQQQPEPEPSQAELEAEFRADDKDLCNAATKIQASFRGHQARKVTQAEKDKEQQDKEDVEKIDLTDPDLNKAATKIQASFRGHKVRKDVPN